MRARLGRSQLERLRPHQGAPGREVEYRPGARHFPRPHPLKMSRRKSNPRPNRVEQRMARAIDKLAAYEEFQQLVLPGLQRALKEGASAEDIYKMAESVAAARAVTIAVKEVDSTKALSAIREILDRTQGKAKERTEHVHKYANLKDEELNALLLEASSSPEETSGDDDGDPVPH